MRSKSPTNARGIFCMNRDLSASTSIFSVFASASNLATRADSDNKSPYGITHETSGPGSVAAGSVPVSIPGSTPPAASVVAAT